MKKNTTIVALVILAIIIQPSANSDISDRDFILRLGLSLCFFAVGLNHTVKIIIEEE